MKTRPAPRAAARVAALALAAALLPGCMQKYSPWDPIGGRYDSGEWFGARFALDLPRDWMMLNQVENGLVATRDGFNLQTVRVRKMKFGADLPHTKKKVSKGMDPQALAEVLLDDLRTDPSANAIKVLETRPETIAGKRGFRTTVGFRDGHGLRFKAVLCGVIAEGRAWQITYVAPARYYFDRDLPTFDSALGSLRIW
ncbi:hypothetical protein [Anaeromyxobacter oryzisoli]|uniref:hypothetical protein n=1 Tax=Anaeromyxobacter oryzisoli TaxID=2925408 RepID=UPI001F592014|nr:hypothetical protein [Anaeromyxobacter sp. SG63]